MKSGALLTLLAAATAAMPAAAAEHVMLSADRKAVVEIRTAALIMSGQQGGALPIALGALPRSAGGAVAWTAMVEIDGPALLEGRSEASPLVVEVFAYVLGQELEVVDQRSLSLDVEAGRHGDLLEGTGLKVFLSLEVPAGRHTLRVLARAGEAFGLRSLELPAAAPGSTPVPWPVFHELERPWLIAVAAGARDLLPPPFDLAGGAPLPTTRPLLLAGETLDAQVFVTGAAGRPWRLEALLRGPDGEVRAAPLEVVGRAAAGPGLETVDVELPAPDLEDGLHEIAVALAPDGADLPHESRSRFVPLFVEAGPAAAPPAAATAAAAEPEEPLSRAQRGLLRAVSDGYRKALRQLAAGERRSAAATLEASETRVAAALDADALPVLAQGESRVVAPLDDADWGCLLPVIQLHIDLSRAYRRSQRHLLTHHAADLAADLAAAYARKLATPEAEREAARALSNLAGDFQVAGALSRAEQLFLRALDLAEDDAASLGLASIREKRGHYDQAVPALEAFVASRPGHPEGRLRLAVNRCRIGQIEAARAALEELAAETGDGDGAWAKVLAHQELARLEIDRDRLEQAAAVLHRGLERWPGHPALTLQLAWVLDAGGDPRASRRLLAGLDLAGEDHAADERSRYNRWSREILRADRAALAEAAEARLEDLGRCLDRLPAAEGG